ncbi:gamma-glutamyltransferase [Candidatus Parabeggiatoa sp. HSG14]|uniref:gamma-glutamyltransferase n=1 Tax=Candidatus Parabeggiatoa sp. HSG14 TaxID=3055593 RepID=UPI0025A72852|nr:gamma-glutamyltransferase [Thiotrichales bacterium HSG14]
MKTLKKVILLKFLLLLFVSFAVAQPAIISQRDIFSPVEAKNSMVVTDDPIATKIGVKILKRGGNAVDAAVTIGFVMAVTFPRAGNIGGGGFMLTYSAKARRVVAIDYRETAPALAHRNMFLDKEGRVNSKLTRFSHLSAGIPGTVAGLALALEKYGTLSLKEVLAPAITLAEKGFVVTPKFSNTLKKYLPIFSLRNKSKSIQKIFLKPNGHFYESGDIFVQPDLAKTLKAIAKNGTKAFYQGKIADLIVKEMENNGGLITKTDLANYKAVIRQPVRGTYRGYDVYSMSPPSSGGVHLIQLLNILEPYQIESLGHNSATTIHLMSEAMKRAYADRSKYLGDPDFVDMPIEGLTSKEYATTLRKLINKIQATPSQDILPGIPPGYESNETTHYSVVDKDGNAVSNTYTLNFSFGSGIVVQNAGFFLNNEMDDFSAKPGVANIYGLIGGSANAIEPHKRMLSSMSPTIVLKEGNPFLITGSPGGSKIITTTLQIIMNVITHKMNIQEAVNALRIHHQWLPDELRVEEGISLDTLKLLTGMKHEVVVKNAMGSASSILIDQTRGIFYGAADPRRGGIALGF